MSVPAFSDISKPSNDVSFHPGCQLLHLEASNGSSGRFLHPQRFPRVWICSNRNFPHEAIAKNEMQPVLRTKSPSAR